MLEELEVIMTSKAYQRKQKNRQSLERAYAGVTRFVYAAGTNAAPGT